MKSERALLRHGGVIAVKTVDHDQRNALIVYAAAHLVRELSGDNSAASI